MGSSLCLSDQIQVSQSGLENLPHPGCISHLQPTVHTAVRIIFLELRYDYSLPCWKLSGGSSWPDTHFLTRFLQFDPGISSLSCSPKFHILQLSVTNTSLFLKILFLLERQRYSAKQTKRNREREKEKARESPICWLTCQMATKAGAELLWSHQPELPLGLLHECMVSRSWAILHRFTWQ